MSAQKGTISISSREIFKISIPLLLIYATLGQSFTGKYLLTIAGVSGDWLDLGQYLYQFAFATLLLLIIPLWIIQKKWEGNHGFFGSQRGNWKFGKIILYLSPVIVLALFIGSSDPALINTYPMSKSVLKSVEIFIIYEIIYGLCYYIPYEFFFRGFLQLGLSKQFKPIVSILIVTGITTALHWMKPFSEILGAFAVGFIFGYIAQKSDSWYYVWWVHYIVGLSNDIFCGLRFLGLL